MSALVLFAVLSLAPADAPASDRATSSATSTAPSEAAREHEAPVRAPPELIIAGSAAAGFVGGALLAMPALFSLLPLAGPLVAASVALSIVGLGAGFGGFLGALTATRIPSALIVGSSALGGALLGAAVLSIGFHTALASTTDPATAFLGALAGAAIGGMGGAAGVSALTASFVLPPPPDETAPAGSRVSADGTSTAHEPPATATPTESPTAAPPSPAASPEP